jgi:hypothetical protein
MDHEVSGLHFVVSRRISSGENGTTSKLRPLEIRGLIDFGPSNLGAQVPCNVPPSAPKKYMPRL